MRPSLYGNIWNLCRDVNYSLVYSKTQTYMDRQDRQDKNQKQDKCSFFRAKAMNPYLFRPRNVTLTHQIPHFFRCCRTRLR